MSDHVCMGGTHCAVDAMKKEMDMSSIASDALARPANTSTNAWYLIRTTDRYKTVRRHARCSDPCGTIRVQNS